MLLLAGKKIVFGLHARPLHKRFLYVRPFLEVLSMLGILKGIHAVNQADALMLRRILKRINVFYIPNGVDCKQFRPDAGKKGDDVFQILFVGALSEDKGVDIVLQVGMRLKTQYPRANIKIVIASVGGPLEDEVRDTAEKSFVEYRGFVSDKMLARLYSESHAVLLPSRNEAFSLTALEAQASGTPVVCSDIAGYRQMIRDGYSGVIVKKYDASSFVDAIVLLYQLYNTQYYEYLKMCTNARKNAERFSWDKVAHALFDRFLE